VFQPEIQTLTETVTVNWY